jgi:plastocyanin
LSANRRLTILGAAALATGVTALSLTGGVAAGHHSKANKAVQIIAGGSSPRNYTYNDVKVQPGSRLQVVDKNRDFHTLTLVTKKSLPNSASEYKHCFPKGICGIGAAWHKFHDGHIHVNPVQAGKKGWDKEGSSLKNKGDSVVYTPGKLPKNRRVTAPSGTVLHYMCIIHPNMQGTITVK